MSYPLPPIGDVPQHQLPKPLPPIGHVPPPVPVPQACKQGYVWREAVPGDFVCVTPQTRDETASENVLGPSHQEPGGGDTCKLGFVWRETRPSDHVCVPPNRRERARVDNELAAVRMLYPPDAPSNGIRVWDEYDGSDNHVIYKVFGTFIPNGKVAFYAYDEAYYPPAPGLIPLNKFSTDDNGLVVGFIGHSLARRDTFYRFPCSSYNYDAQQLRSAPIIVVDEKSGIVSNAGKLKIPTPHCQWWPPNEF
ncbi:hypothetical protein HNP81_004840 [Peribacillus huizhouensis]|uniref:Uncharacterized protein n=1 Tax=Peribacillus huizhouensis TaxID=1501239 RepID=A0ABR6CXL2_9BACI|nr:hypothetical protein [Peribacillus huizhouensis]